MRIVIIAPDAYPVSYRTGGSVEISIYQIAKRLSKKHTVTIISRKSDALSNVFKKGNLTIMRIPGGDQYLKKAIYFLQNHPFDVVQVENRPRYVLTLRRFFPHIPIVLMLHSLTFMSFLSELHQQQVVEHATMIICNSQFIAQHYKQLFPDYAEKFYTMHLGVDLKRFALPMPEKKEKLLKRFSLEDTYNILYVGRVVPKKGIHILIRAAAILKLKYPNIQVVIVGYCKNKTYKSKLEDEAITADVPIRFIGGFPPSKIHRAYWLGDCFVCPTQYEEAFGLVNIEAMASGLPVIASYRGGIPEILDETNGILIKDYLDPEAFASNIEKLIESPSLATELATNGIETVFDKFSWSHVTTQFDEFYRSLIN